MKQTNKPPTPPAGGAMNRRGFIRIGIGAAAALLFPVPVIAAAPPDRRVLSLLNRHTGEKLSACYFSNGRYQSSALDEINLFLRDHRNDDVMDIDRRLLDMLWELAGRLGSDGPFHVFSGYRSPETNRILRARSKSVAKASYHTLGKAADVYLPDCRLSQLRAAAIRMKRGGVGYYPRPHFVHVDVGPVRTW